MNSRDGKTNETLYRQLAEAGDTQGLVKLVETFPQLNVNARDPESGRTALHLAAVKRHAVAMQQVSKHGGDRVLEDNCGFTAEELWMSPFEYYPFLSLDSIDANKPYCQFIIDEMNAALPSHSRIVAIRRLDEINQFLAANPQLEKVGFVVKKPNCLRRIMLVEDSFIRDDHTSPIFYAKAGKDGEYFVHMDSIMGYCYSVPKSTSGVARTMYYYPHFRQYDNTGCFEDAAGLLFRLLKAPEFDFNAFCKANAKRDSDILKPLSTDERELQRRLDDQRFRTGFRGIDEKRFLALTRRRHKSLLDQYYKSRGMESVADVFQLTSFPPMLLAHIEFYATMTALRAQQPSLFAQRIKVGGSSTVVLDYLLKVGSKRFPQTNDRQIKANLVNTDQRYDFAGIRFADRRERYEQHQHSKSYLLIRLFEGALTFKPAAKITAMVTGCAVPEDEYLEAKQAFSRTA